MLYDHKDGAKTLRYRDAIIAVVGVCPNFNSIPSIPNIHDSPTGTTRQSCKIIPRIKNTIVVLGMNASFSCCCPVDGIGYSSDEEEDEPSDSDAASVVNPVSSRSKSFALVVVLFIFMCCPFEIIAPFACPLSVDNANENPTQNDNPVTLFSVVANAPDANPCSPKLPKNRNVMNHGILLSTNDWSAGTAVLSCSRSSVAKQLRFVGWSS
mmetsp:Transcript_21667/g.51178  ORF Transcript_21667/g.51178 Transcript_21667/m.51178 type:complete len:210 (+) Transcript_21667:1066-1695(+)